MKKALPILLAVIMVAAISVPVYADNFVGSIEAKIAPETGVIEVPHGEGGSKAVKALIVETEDTDDIIEGVPDELQRASADELTFYVTSVAEKDEAVTPEIKEALESSEKQINAVSNVSELGGGSVSEEIDEAIKEFNDENGAAVDKNDLVVSDLFDASLVLNDEVLQKLAVGQSCAFLIKPGFAKGDFFVLLHNTEGMNWEVVKNVEWVTVDGEDYLKIIIDHLSVFALAVEKQAELPVKPDAPQAPQTDIGTDIHFLYAGIAVLCIGAAAFFFVKAGKKSKAD